MNKPRGQPEGQAGSKALSGKVLGVFKDPHGLARVRRRTERKVTAMRPEGQPGA